MKKERKEKKSYLRKISDAAILGGMSAILVTGLLGCDSGSSNSTAQEMSNKKGVTVTLQEEADGSYKIIDEQPSSDGDTTIIVRDVDGNKRILSKEEVDALVAEEAKKIDNGTSTLTSSDGGGSGIGGAILASAAGALIGSYIGNKLFNNANYKANAQRASAPSAYQRPAASSTTRPATSTATSTKATPSNAKSGFFGSNNSNTSTATS